MITFSSLCCLTCTCRCCPGPQARLCSSPPHRAHSASDPPAPQSSVTTPKLQIPAPEPPSGATPSPADPPNLPMPPMAPEPATAPPSTHQGCSSCWPSTPRSLCPTPTQLNWSPGLKEFATPTLGVPVVTSPSMPPLLRRSTRATATRREPRREDYSHT